MALEDVTPAYVDLLSYNKYVSRTSNAPEFEAVRDMMSVYLNSSPSAVPDKKYTHGLALLICHYYALDDTQDPDEGQIGDDLTKGPVIEETTGDVTVKFDRSIAYSVTESDKTWQNWLTLTVYGRQFLTLMRTFKSTPRVT